MRAIVFALVALTCTASGASAQLFVSTGRDTLRGLPGVEVVVEPLQPELERLGLSGGRLSADIGRQLTAAGITIYASQRQNPSPSQPYLYVHLNAVSTPDGRDIAVAVQVHVRQTLSSLTTESKIVNAMSWDAHSVRLMTPPMLESDVLDELRDLVARFVDDWRAVH